MKIFCIGLSRTGTSSLTVALNMLGYSTAHFAMDMLELKNNMFSINKPFINQYDSFSDIPTVICFKELHRLYPDSKFILTIREQKSWLSSCKRLFNKEVYNIWKNRPKKVFTKYRKLHHAIYRTKIIYKRKPFIDAYFKHSQEVGQYFQNNLENLLVMDICNNDGWTMLCAFLNKPVPDIPFPHLRSPRNIEDFN